jgi:hypothetical protein
MKDWRPTLTAIEDPIADDTWTYKTRSGLLRTSRVTIGRPAPLKDKRDWYCPVLFEHVTDGIHYAYGVGPVDALMNAMQFVRRRFMTFKDVRPRATVKASKRPARKSPT